MILRIKISIEKMDDNYKRYNTGATEIDITNHIKTNNYNTFYNISKDFEKTITI